MSSKRNCRFFLLVTMGFVAAWVCWIWLGGESAAGNEFAQRASSQLKAALIPSKAAGEMSGVATMVYLPVVVGQPIFEEQIAFETVREGNYEIYLMKPDGSGQTNLSRHPAKDVAPAWSPDGRRIAFVSDRDGNEEIYVMNRDGSDVRRLTFNPALDGWPTWSPDGTQIAFQSDRDSGPNPKFDIFVMNADGSGQAPIASHPAHDRWPDWSPDGKWITFTSNREGGVKKIYVVRPDGSRLRLLSELNVGYDDRYSTWSPDGRISFVSNRKAPGEGDDADEIYLLGVSGIQQLTNNDAGDWLARWSPDGLRFVFYTDRDGNKNVYVKDIVTGAEIRATNSLADDEYPVWSP